MSGEPNPFSTGGGGTSFEWLVATSYVISLLAGHTARGLPGTGTVVEVRLQQRGRGYPVDDIIVIVATGTAQAKLILQAKHSLTFTVNDLFCETLLDCWNQFHSENFDKARDSVGIAIAESCNIGKIRTHFQALLSWARTHSQTGFYEQLSKYKAKQSALEVFSDGLTKATSRKPGTKMLWDFLGHLQILSFDVENPGSRDSEDSWNKLKILCRQDQSHAVSLFNGIFRMISDYSKDGGEIDLDALQKELQERLPLKCYTNLRTVRASLIRQVVNQLNKEKKSQKYIPDIFTEIQSVKESGRLFSHPVLFVTKLADDLDRIDLSFVNRILSKIRVPLVGTNVLQQVCLPSRLSTMQRTWDVLQTHTQELGESLSAMSRSSHAEFGQRVPEERAHIFNESRFLLGQASDAVRGRLRHLEENLRAGKSRVFILTSRAGQGKTNFVCDFCEKFLLPHRIPCMLITARQLRNVHSKQLGARLVELALGEDFKGSFRDFLRLVGEICEERDAPFTLIFDGINEHHNIPDFSQALEDLITEIIEIPYVRVIITCRTEYYEERFRNLTQASFSDQICHVRDMNSGMSSWARDQLKAAYFKHFKISPSSISPGVNEILGTDPLLLRFFCEAYGDPDARQPIKLEYMPDIYRPEIFEKYLKKKLEEVVTRNQSERGLEVGRYNAYHDVLGDLVGMMINRKQFSDIPVSDIDPRHKAALAELLDEDVFFRKDLPQGKSILDARSEVINFTFDEFRDFLLGDHLVYRLWENSSPENFGELLLNLTSGQVPVAEGVSRFVFYADRKSDDKNLHHLIEGMPWYEDTYFECIFAIRDHDVKNSDIMKIRQAFGRDESITKQIVFRLIERWNTDLTPKINIDLLFEIIGATSDDDYRRLIRPIFEGAYRYGGPSVISDLVSDLRRMINPRENQWDLRYSKLIELLVFLFPISDGYRLPAFDAFRDFVKQQPQQDLSFLEKHLCIGLSAVRTRVWEMLAELAGLGITVPETIIDQARNRQSELGESESRERDEITRLLRHCTTETRPAVRDDTGEDNSRGEINDRASER
jgi:hypothetical protein